MSDKTQIGWTDSTWNPISGCSKISPGCEHCYAETLSHRFGWTSKPWIAPNAHENVQLHPERLDKPLRWTKSRMIFVNSTSDLFHDAVPDSFIDEVFAIMTMTGRHTYQILTKRPQRTRDYLRHPDTVTRVAAAIDRRDDHQGYDVLAQDLRDGRAWPLANVWLGVSVEDQRRANERIPVLMEIPAAVRFLSCEPLLGPIDIDHAMYGHWEHSGMNVFGFTDGVGYEVFIQWVIAGAESGPKARPMDDDWVRSLRDQCQTANVPFYFKQRVHAGHKEIAPFLDGRQWLQFPSE